MSTTLVSSLSLVSAAKPEEGRGRRTSAVASLARRKVYLLVEDGAMKYSWQEELRSRQLLVLESSVCILIILDMFSSSSLHPSMVAEVGTARSISPINRD